jgi:hypothetical protein
MSEPTQAIVEDYMRQLKKELKSLPKPQREEILADIKGHVDESLGPNGSSSEADTRLVLDQLGDPAEIAAEARQRFGVEGDRFGGHEIAAVILLPLGAIAFGFGWIAGVILLWSSKLWTTGEKLIGTFVPPGGLITVVSLVPVLSGPGELQCNPKTKASAKAVGCHTTGWGTGDILELVLLGLLIAVSIAVPIWLGVRARRRGRSPAR